MFLYCFCDCHNYFQDISIDKSPVELNHEIKYFSHIAHCDSIPLLQYIHIHIQNKGKTELAFSNKVATTETFHTGCQNNFRIPLLLDVSTICM